LQLWIADSFPDLNTKLAYQVPFYFLSGSNSKYWVEKIFYLHYYEIDGVLVLEICFVKGVEMDDKYNLFQSKNMPTKAIIIENTSYEFMKKIEYYINQSLKIS
jgi:hypothetical protein